MNKNFPLNRFSFSSLIASIQTAGELPDVVTDAETGIEFYGAGTIPRDELVDFLENFNILDNFAQADARQKYEQQGQLEVEYFQFEPSWVEITASKVIIGYVGIYVSTDFNLTFYPPFQNYAPAGNGLIN